MRRREAKVSDTGVLHNARRFQRLESAALWVEERRTGSQQDVDEVETQLIEESRRQELAADVGPPETTTSPSSAASRADASARSMPSEMNVKVLPPGSTISSAGRCVTTKTGKGRAN
jgi:hypothetical protein